MICLILSQNFPKLFRFALLIALLLVLDTFFYFDHFPICFARLINLFSLLRDGWSTRPRLLVKQAAGLIRVNDDSSFLISSPTSKSVFFRSLDILSNFKAALNMVTIHSLVENYAYEPFYTARFNSFQDFLRTIHSSYTVLL